MANQFDVVAQLISGYLPESDRLVRLQEFSRELGWRPTDRLDSPTLREITGAQLLVEHGLENSAVVSFLRSPKQYSTLSSEERQALLSTSYNNLVDWHVAIDGAGISFVYVRTRIPTPVARHEVSRENYESLRSEIFEQVVGRRPSPNIPALDDALIKTISIWKRSLNAELGNDVSNAQLASLFNSLIFVRALEDQRRRLNNNASDILLDRWRSPNPPATVRALLTGAMQELAQQEIPAFLFRDADLEPFDQLGHELIQGILFDFYENRFAPYRYDFAVISKHALSRIYEQYVSLLRQDESAQLSLIPQLPPSLLGQVPWCCLHPLVYRALLCKVSARTPPAISVQEASEHGPGMWFGYLPQDSSRIPVRPTNDSLPRDLLSTAFQNAVGLDRDPNAVAAAQLSLSLLHLVLTNLCPQAFQCFQRTSLTPLLPRMAQLALRRDPNESAVCLPRRARCSNPSALGRVPRGSGKGAR